MAKPQAEPHDLRDDIYKPSVTPTDTNETFVGAPPTAVDPETGNLRLVTPTPGKGVPEGAATKG
jgi:hypothetical protein